MDSDPNLSESEMPSSHDTFQDSSSDDVESDDHVEEQTDDPFPLLKYSRITGSLPRSSVSSYDCNFSYEKQTEIKSRSGMLKVHCYCASLGKVGLLPAHTPSSLSQQKNRDLNGIDVGGLHEYTVVGDGGSSGMNITGLAGGGGSSLISDVPHMYHILALGMMDGSIHIIDPSTGRSYCPSTCLKIVSSGTTSSTPVPAKNEMQSPTFLFSDSKVDNSARKRGCVVDVSFDSSGSYLAAITQVGDVAIFHFRFGKASFKSSQARGMMSHGSPTSTTASSTQPTLPGTSSTQTVNMFESFLSKLSGDDRANRSSQLSESKLSSESQGESLSKDVHVHSLSTARFHYHKPMQTQSSSPPTCVAIDPSYRRRKEKAIVIGFEDGRLILTKRSSHGGSSESIVTGSVGSAVINTSGAGIGGAMSVFLQPRRRDIEIYHGAPRQSASGPRGIEALTWRGSLIAWADSSGIKLFDVEHMARIAHIDRPSGAKVELYPTISSLRPSLVFERCDSLLIAWGDCLMSMNIKDEAQSAITFSNSDDASEKQATLSKGPSYKVDCVMAWQMDCITCDVVPLDSDHVLVLGLVPVVPQNGENQQGADEKASNLVEVQIISRSNRNMISCDAVPLLRDATVSKEADSNIQVDDACMFSLLSSFCTPRQEDTVEALDEVSINADNDSFDVASIMQSSVLNPLVEYPTTGGKVSRFVDPHMRWSINEVRRLDSDNNYVIDTEEKIDDESSESDSEYSDHYSFLFQHQSIHAQGIAAKVKGDPPLLIIKSQTDLILAETRDIDDAILFARTKGLHGTALRRALLNRKYLRRHTLRQLVDEYLSALLFPSVNQDSRDSVALYRRLQLAARATAVLIGGDIDSWIRWIFEFAKIPGGLFLLRPYLPVRDPKLPSLLYEFILDKLYIDTVSLIRKADTIDVQASSTSVSVSASDMYINALYGWGPTTILNARIRYLYAESSDQSKEMLSQAEMDIRQRFSQTASSFLQYPSSIHISNPQNGNDITNHSITLDSLFDIAIVETQLHQHLASVNSINSPPSIQHFLHLHFQALSSLAWMRGSYEEAFKWLLYVYCYDSSHVTSIEQEASRALHDKDFYVIGKSLKVNKFAYVAHLVKKYRLQRLLLLEPNILFDKIAVIDVQRIVSDPLFAFICLLGLDRSGDFLVEHCSGASKYESLTELPIDEVAIRLKPHPKILCWFLNLMLYRKPEIYISFSNTSIPPQSIVELHRCHFELLVDLTDIQSYKIHDLSEVPRYDEVHRETPLLYLLKKSIPIGGVTAVDARKILTMKREPVDINATQGSSTFYSSTHINNVKYPFLFAKELAYLLESYGPPSEDASKTVLSLYLDGASSLPLSVEYAERNTQFSHMLWTYLVSYCLGDKIDSSSSNKGTHGNLFGTLLEVAARYGADLAFLVSQIPENLQVEGLRSKLVCAIQDYRLKVKIHDAVKTISCADKVHLIRDLHHISRRAKRIEYIPAGMKPEDKNEIPPLISYTCRKRSHLMFLPIK